jgi:hypothetical protein
MLMGTAVMRNPLPWGNEPSFQSRLGGCRRLMSTLGVAGQQCQLITGRFPDAPSASMKFAPDCIPLPGVFSGKAYNAVEVGFAGKVQTLTVSNWAYQQYSLPGTTGGDFSMRGDLSSWENTSFGGWYETADITACIGAALPDGAELTDTYEPATQSGNGQLLWSGTNVETNSFIVHRRNADEIGNALLAGGAAMAALAVGFIPVAYDAERERRRALKRQRARQAT